MRGKKSNVAFSDRCCPENDFCNTVVTGRPGCLSVYAPVVYDEMGVNICRQIEIPEEILNDYPTAMNAQLDVIDITFAEETEETPSTTITNTIRANCSTIVLTNIEVTFRVKLFDSGSNFLDSFIVTANYLPGNESSPDYEFEDDDTNPESVTMELYTPYGVGYTDVEGEEFINVVGFLSGTNTVVNGINASIVAKAMDFNRNTGMFTAGISLFLRTVYYETYKFEHNGKPVVPKASLDDVQGNSSLRFVESGLLSREIKPLELEPPRCEGNQKNTEIVCEQDDGNITVVNPCDCENSETLSEGNVKNN